MQNQEPREMFVRIIEGYFAIHPVPANVDRARLLTEMVEFYIPRSLGANLPMTAWEFERSRAVFAGYIREAMDNTFGPESRWTN